MTADAVDVHVLPTDAPDDTAGLETLFDSGAVRPSDVICILGKTEGNGCVNDFSRGLASRAYRDCLADRMGVAPDTVQEEVLLIMSGGTEGVMTPHVTVFSRSSTETAAPEEKRLAAGTATTAAIAPEDIGRTAQIDQTAAAVSAAMADAGIEDPDDVAFVQIKCPLLTAGRIAEARDRGASVAVSDTYKSMGYSRAASALGVARARGKIDADAISDDVICGDPGLYSSVASTSAGVELTHSEVLVLGNSEAARSAFAIGGAVMDDALDTAAMERAVRHAAPDADADSVVNVFAKAEASRDGEIRGRRHVIHNDSDIESTRHARAVVSSVVGAVTGDPLSYVSGGAEHQGPDGGGPVAAIVDRT
mgnify:CR=1 FL=1